MFVLGIDKATTHLVLLHINQVEFDDARYIAIFLMLFRTFFSRQLQEHAGSQSDLIGALTFIALAAGMLAGFIAIVCGLG